MKTLKSHKCSHLERSVKLDDKVALKDISTGFEFGLTGGGQSSATVKVEHPELDALNKKLEAIKISYMMRLRINY